MWTPVSAASETGTPLTWGFAETLGCLQTSLPITGELLPPMSLNGIDMLIIFTWGILVTFALSWVCDMLIGKFVMGKLPAPGGADAQDPATAGNE